MGNGPRGNASALVQRRLQSRWATSGQSAKPATLQVPLLSAHICAALVFCRDCVFQQEVRHAALMRASGWGSHYPMMAHLLKGADDHKELV